MSASLCPSAMEAVMKLPQSGGCRCGKIRYEITEAPQLVYTCHCKDCERLTSSAFAIAMAASEMAFRVMGADPRILQTVADSGRVKTRWVCPECGCWICGASSADKDLRHVRCGTLDDTSWLRPTVYFWTRSKQPWLTQPEGDQTSRRSRQRSSDVQRRRLSKRLPRREARVFSRRSRPVISTLPSSES